MTKRYTVGFATAKDMRQFQRWAGTQKEVTGFHQGPDLTLVVKLAEGHEERFMHKLDNTGWLAHMVSWQET